MNNKLRLVLQLIDIKDELEKAGEEKLTETMAKIIQELENETQNDVLSFKEPTKNEGRTTDGNKWESYVDKDCLENIEYCENEDCKCCKRIQENESYCSKEVIMLKSIIENCNKEIEDLKKVILKSALKNE